MPGRGKPWKGVGEGNPDRIGTAAIADGSITEADLDSSLQTKVNAGGHTIQDEGTPLIDRGNLNFVGAGVIASDGIEDTTTVTIAGGGGGINIFNTAFLQEEFLWDAVDLGAFTQKITLEGGTIATSGLNLTRNGVISLTTAGASAGQSCEVDTSNGFQVSPSGDVIMKQIIAVDSLTNSLIDASMLDSPVGLAATEAIFFSAIGGGFGFIFDPSVSANWRLWTKNAGSVTTVQTTIPVVSGSLIKMTATKTAGLVTFNINGTDEGTINTNIPTQDFFIHTGVFNKTTIQQSMELDAWEVQAVRA